MVVQKLLDELRFLLHRLIDLVAVILVVRQCRIHLCERQPRVYAGSNFFRRQAAQVAGRNDISNPDAMPVNAWLPADNAQCTNDVRIFGLGRSLSHGNSPWKEEVLTIHLTTAKRLNAVESSMERVKT